MSCGPESRSLGNDAEKESFRDRPETGSFGNDPEKISDRNGSGIPLFETTVGMYQLSGLCFDLSYKSNPNEINENANNKVEM
jgi:hypothetical protein